MVKSIRLLYRQMQGRVRCNYNWDWQRMCERSAVFVTAAEWNVDPDNPYRGRPHLGEANVYVTNVGPHDSAGGPGGVEFYLHVDSEVPLDVLVTITDMGLIERTVVIK